MKILYSPKFIRQYKKLPVEIKDKVEKKKIFFVLILLIINLKLTN